MLFLPFSKLQATLGHSTSDIPAPGVVVHEGDVSHDARPENTNRDQTQTEITMKIMMEILIEKLIEILMEVLKSRNTTCQAKLNMSALFHALKISSCSRGTVADHGSSCECDSSALCHSKTQI